MKEKLKRFKFLIWGNNKGEYVTTIIAKNKEEAQKEADKEHTENFGYFDKGKAELQDNKNIDNKQIKKLR